MKTVKQLAEDRFTSLKIDSNFYQIRDSCSDRVVCHAFNDEDACVIEKALNNHELLQKLRWEKIE